jgi:hypothetical protein
MKRESNTPYDKVDSKTGEWLQILSQFLDKVTGEDLLTIYQFQDLVIDVPNAAGPDGKEPASEVKESAIS